MTMLRDLGPLLPLVPCRTKSGAVLWLVRVVSFPLSCQSEAVTSGNGKPEVPLGSWVCPATVTFPVTKAKDGEAWPR